MQHIPNIYFGARPKVISKHLLSSTVYQPAGAVLGAECLPLRERPTQWGSCVWKQISIKVLGNYQAKGIRWGVGKRGPEIFDLKFRYLQMKDLSG